MTTVYEDALSRDLGIFCSVMINAVTVKLQLITVSRAHAMFNRMINLISDNQAQNYIEREREKTKGEIKVEMVGQNGNGFEGIVCADRRCTRQNKVEK